ncbi:MAG: hypothetical protein LBK66_05325 [Spirochaetaceae bacterium]|jgi:hypothetical protein|nr:hypothetical protein [Spirochaetaceae bacterium]
MARMTEEEAWALDDEVTLNPPNVAGKPGGFFTDRRDRMVILDQFSAGYIKSVAQAMNKTPAEIIGELVREKIAAASI